MLPRAFTVMSFRSDLQDLYDEVIAPECLRAGLEPIRADELQYPGVILQDIVRGLQESTVVIAEISADEDKAFNANVFYELGYAHATEKPTILSHDGGPTFRSTSVAIASSCTTTPSVESPLWSAN